MREIPSSDSDQDLDDVRLIQRGIAPRNGALTDEALRKLFEAHGLPWIDDEDLNDRGYEEREFRPVTRLKRTDQEES